MQIKSRRLNRWDKNIRRRLRYATLSYGYLKTYMHFFPRSSTIVAFSGKHVMGWVFILRHSNQAIGSFFTNERYRRRGVATHLAQEALKRFGKIAVVKWDPASKKTFEKLAKRYPSRVAVYTWPTRMPPRCSGCAYCRCH